MYIKQMDYKKQLKKREGTNIFRLLMEEDGEGEHSGPLVQARRKPFPRVVQPARNRPEKRDSKTWITEYTT